MNLTALYCDQKEQQQQKKSTILLNSGYLKNHIEIAYNHPYTFLSFSIEKLIGNKKQTNKKTLPGRSSPLASISLINIKKKKCKNKNLIKKLILLNMTYHLC